jgi:teichuronic acid biosynthesis glycosyltransferase TuaH
MKIILIHHLGSRTNGRPDQLAKYLSKSGNEVHLILWDVPYPITWENIKYNLANSLNYRKFKRGKIIVHKIKRLPFFCPIINKLMFHNQIKKIYKNNNIDLIVSESYINEMEPPKNLPLVYSLVDDFEDYAKFYGSWIYKFAFYVLRVKQTIKKQIQRSNATIVVSDLLVSYAKQYNKNIYKLTNGVESWPITHNFKGKKYNFGKHSLVYVSGFDHWSNLPNLLYSIKEVKKDLPDIKLVLVGDGVQIKRGKKIVKKLNLDKNIKFFGQINNRKKVFEIINSCDVCLNLSEKNHRQDSASPVKIFEYSALGKPIISTKLIEIEGLKFPNIIFYNEGDNKYLIKAIKNSFRKKFNKIKIKKLVSKYTWENIAKKFEKILQGEIK